MTIGFPALLRHELRIARNSARAAFARKRDWLPLAIGVPILLAALASGLRSPSAGGPWVIRLVFALIGVASFAGQTAILRRLQHLRSKTVMAKAALQPRVATIYIGTCHLPGAMLGPAAASAAAPEGMGAQAALIALIAYAGGVVSATVAWRLARFIRALWRGGASERPREGLAQARGRRSSRLTQLLVRRVGLRRLSLAGNIAAFLAIGIGTGFLYILLRGTVRGQLAEVACGAIPLVGLGFLGRQHPPLWRYLLALGVRPAAFALVPLLPATALATGFVAVAAVGGGVPPWALAAGGAVVLLLFALLGLLRALHYATKSRARADLMFQLDLVAIAVAGFLSVVLAPMVALARLWLLRRQAERSRWLVP